MGASRENSQTGLIHVPKEFQWQLAQTINSAHIGISRETSLRSLGQELMGSAYRFCVLCDTFSALCVRVSERASWTGPLRFALTAQGYPSQLGDAPPPAGRDRGTKSFRVPLRPLSHTERGSRGKWSGAQQVRRRDGPGPPRGRCSPTGSRRLDGAAAMCFWQTLLRWVDYPRGSRGGHETARP